jgi:CRP-like cAMP-binding protein
VYDTRRNFPSLDNNSGQRDVYTKLHLGIQAVRECDLKEQRVATENASLNTIHEQVSKSGPQLVGRTDPSGNPLHNKILLAIPEAEFQALRPHLEFSTLTYHQSLHESTEGIHQAWFLNRGMASLVVTTTDGRSVEVGVVGKEGWVGAPLAVGLRRSPYRAIVQIPGDGVRVRAEILVELLGSTRQLRQLLNRYSQLQAMQVAQLAACNRLHEIEQRLARWMLMCQDRTEADMLPMTHEFFAQMLGAGRPSVTLAAGVLQRAGIIRYSRGKVNILNREALENASCECYRVIQQFNGEKPSTAENPSERHNNGGGVATD